MAGHQNPGIERDQLVECGDPGAAVGVADKRHAAAKHQVAGIEHAVFLHQHRQIFAGMGRADVAQRELHAAHFKIRVAFQKAVRFQQLRVVVHPGEERFLALGEALRRPLRCGWRPRRRGAPRFRRRVP